MKMENYVYAPVAGIVTKIFVGPSDGVEGGDTLITLDVADETLADDNGIRPSENKEGGRR
jgi:acetyl-CoA/propionyl-CoA carboxylase biotin carboxyl carrier protein